MQQTNPSVQAVHLVGSWDNFSKAYTMERDSRRDRGQWRGCHTFENIICDGDAETVPKRTGGLKMGSTYYYYYELDGSAEIHDPSLPSTTACPYLPGQAVNTLWIPVEQSLRKRSASMNSLCQDDFKTMDPASKFITPKPAQPPVPSRRLGTAPQQHKRSARSLSPASGWSSFSPRKLFSRKTSSNSLKDVQAQSADDERMHERMTTRSEGSRSRDISPESLRRFLIDDTPLEEKVEQEPAPIISIPEDIVEENEDDDNFATSAVSETMQFTGLSPPPQRSPSPPVVLPMSKFNLPASVTAPRSKRAALPVMPRIQAPVSVPKVVAASPKSAEDSDSTPPAFYFSEDDDDEEEEVFSAKDEQPIAPFAAKNLSTYSLPQSISDRTIKSATGNMFLDAPIPDSDLGDLVSELGWMADFIRGKYDA
ncbi:hypothetical protein QBC35DRAFT_515886 [Podospora australis]|uniref:Uncharacterized protein n=1 Tax=Podospora australis TaxID=1536484 RepID=A0AAN6WRY7_9PEZI|nr:hypothetical protein QBC35DRAFT_515886 [Podospora australis]